MADQSAEETVRAFYAVANRLADGGTLSVDDERLIAPGFRAYAAGMPPMDKDAFMDFTIGFATSFPGYSITIDDLVLEGDRVATRVTWRGRHLGDFQGIDPTGRGFEVMGMHFDRVTEEGVVEHWGMFDAVGLLQQLGILPGPEA